MYRLVVSDSHKGPNGLRVDWEILGRVGKPSGVSQETG
jgi:hypothetical protein